MMLQRGSLLLPLLCITGYILFGAQTGKLGIELKIPKIDYRQCSVQHSHRYVTAYDNVIQTMTYLDSIVVSMKYPPYEISVKYPRKVSSVVVSKIIPLQPRSHAGPEGYW